MSPQTYHIEGVLGVTKTALKRSIWKQAEGSHEAQQAVELLESRRGGMFTLIELISLLDWLQWQDAAADGEEVTGLTAYRDARCKRRYDRASSKITELQEREKNDGKS